MDCSSQRPCTFTVDHAYPEYPLLPADREIFRKQVFHILRAEGMQVQDTVYWQLDRMLRCFVPIRFTLFHGRSGGPEHAVEDFAKVFYLIGFRYYVSEAEVPVACHNGGIGISA